MMASWLTLDEKLRLSRELVADQSATLGWTNVSMTQLSIARHSGGATVNGHRYTYFPAADELWRDDVVKAVNAWRNEAKAAEAAWHRTAEQFVLDLWNELL
jgi:hypothetical protein